MAAQCTAAVDGVVLRGGPLPGEVCREDVALVTGAGSGIGRLFALLSGHAPSLPLSPGSCVLVYHFRVFRLYAVFLTDDDERTRPFLPSCGLFLLFLLHPAASPLSGAGESSSGSVRPTSPTNEMTFAAGPPTSSSLGRSPSGDGGPPRRPDSRPAGGPRCRAPRTRGTSHRLPGRF